MSPDHVWYKSPALLYAQNFHRKYPLERLDIRNVLELVQLCRANLLTVPQTSGYFPRVFVCLLTVSGVSKLGNNRIKSLPEAPTFHN